MPINIYPNGFMKSNRLKIIIVTLFALMGLFVNSWVWAKTELSQCKAVGFEFQNDNLILKLDPKSSQAERLYVLQNISNGVVLLNRVATSPAAMGLWTSQFMSRRWSALIAVTPDFVLTCKMIKLHFEHVTVPCKQVLKVCQLPLAKITDPEFVGRGLWVVENRPSFDEVVKAIEEKNLKLS